MAITLPGFDSPAVGFEQPFEMLYACHDRVRRSLALLERLIEHIDTHGHDASSRAAATDVLRYFELAAPQHHEDEERHVFPLLMDDGEASLRAAVQALQHDHQRMDALWHELRVALSHWSRAQSAGAIDDQTRHLADEFVAIYAGHLQREEGLVFPAALQRSDAQRLAEMGAEMQQRRRSSAPSAARSRG